MRDARYCRGASYARQAQNYEHLRHLHSDILPSTTTPRISFHLAKRQVCYFRLNHEFFILDFIFGCIGIWRLLKIVSIRVLILVRLS